jgi:hypothetical protein
LRRVALERRQFVGALHPSGDHGLLATAGTPSIVIWVGFWLAGGSRVKRPPPALLQWAANDKLRRYDVAMAIVATHMAFDLCRVVVVVGPIDFAHDHRIRGNKAILQEDVDGLFHGATTDKVLSPSHI